MPTIYEAANETPEASSLCFPEADTWLNAMLITLANCASGCSSEVKACKEQAYGD